MFWKALPLMRWIRHTAMVPKGFLRYQVLRLLKEKPMSGSEIMSEIEEETDGNWRPSPGSIYPLLAWLQDNGYVNEAEGEPGIKRYSLTEKGGAFLEENVQMQEKLGKRLAHYGPGPGLMGPPWHEFFPEKAGSALRKPAIGLAMALWDLNEALSRNYSAEEAEEAGRTLEEASRRIEEITRRLGGA